MKLFCSSWSHPIWLLKLRDIFLFVQLCPPVFDLVNSPWILACHLHCKGYKCRILEDFGPKALFQCFYLTIGCSPVPILVKSHIQKLDATFHMIAISIEYWAQYELDILSIEINVTLWFQQYITLLVWSTRKELWVTFCLRPGSLELYSFEDLEGRFWRLESFVKGKTFLKETNHHREWWLYPSSFLSTLCPNQETGLLHKCSPSGVFFPTLCLPWDGFSLALNLQKIEVWSFNDNTHTGCFCYGLVRLEAGVYWKVENIGRWEEEHQEQGSM